MCGTCLGGHGVELEEVAVRNGFQGGVVHLAMSSALVRIDLDRRIIIIIIIIKSNETIIK